MGPSSAISTKVRSTWCSRRSAWPAWAASLSASWACLSKARLNPISSSIRRSWPPTSFATAIARDRASVGWIPRLIPSAAMASCLAVTVAEVSATLNFCTAEVAFAVEAITLALPPTAVATSAFTGAVARSSVCRMSLKTRSLMDPLGLGHPEGEVLGVHLHEIAGTEMKERR